MGKKSLIKSTDKKDDKDKAAKAASTKGKKTEQKGKAKKTASAPVAQKAKEADVKAQPKEAPAQKQAPAATEVPPQQASPPAQKSEQKAQKVSISSLLKRQFAPIGPLPKPVSMPAPKRPKPGASADAPVENRAVLFRKFDMDEINKAAKEPVVEKKKPAKEQAPAKKAALVGQEMEKDMPASEADQIQEPAQDPALGLEKELDFYEPTVWEQTNAYVDSFFESAQKALFSFLGFFNEMLYGVKKSLRQKDSSEKNAAVILGAAILGSLLLLLVITSYLNAGHYYFVPAQDGYEMHKGRFAPMGKQKVEVFPGLDFAEAPREFYSAKAAHDIAKIYFLAQADHFLKDLELPDYTSARESLRQALAYAPTFKERALIQSRINRLDFERLVLEADAALVENASQSINKARSLLDQAAQLAQTPEQRALLAEERRRISAALEALKN
jgi:hypothetical protein